MYAAAPFSRSLSASAVTSLGSTPVMLPLVSGLHLVVAVTSLFALTLAMGKLLPAREKAWATSPVPHASASRATRRRRRGLLAR